MSDVGKGKAVGQQLSAVLLHAANGDWLCLHVWLPCSTGFSEVYYNSLQAASSTRAPGL